MPHSASAPRLGDLERVVMEHLWEASTLGGASFGGATVREVHDRFEGEREIAYTTVMTVLARLWDKGLVTRQRSGRAFGYQAVLDEDEITARQMRRLLDARGDHAAVLSRFVGTLSADDERLLVDLLGRTDEADDMGRGQ